jgi:hypothetical protein
MSTQLTEPAPSPRVRPWLRRVAIVAVVLLMPVVAYNAWDYIELRRLTREIEAIRARGEPVEDQLIARDYAHLPADQQRAGDYYIAAAMLALHTAAGAAMGPVHLWLSTAGAGTTPVPATLVDDLHRVVDASPEALALVDKAATLEFGGLPPGTDMANRIGGMQRLSLLIGARTLAASLAGRGDDAIDSARAAIAMRRAMEELPWVPQSDYELAAIFSLSTPSAEALQRLDATLTSSAPPIDPAQALLTMRAQFLSQNWHRYYGTNPEMPVFYTLPMRSLEETLLRPLITQRLVRGLQSWSAMIPATHLSMGQLEAMEEIARARAQAIPEIGAAFARARAYTTALAIDRSARTLVAIERYRRDHNGTLPASLAQLVPAFASAVPLDPIDNAPLRFRAQADAYVVYSIGLDHKDDEGDLTSTLRPGASREWAARSIRGRDVGVRVLLRPAKTASR